MSRGEIREMVRQFPEYVDGRLDDARVEKIVEGLYADQDAIVAEHTKAEISRELMRMAARGEVEYDPEQKAWRPTQ